MALKIVFMGTPEFAVPSLRILVEHGYEIVGVITAPDRLGGRGMRQVIESPVKKAAEEMGLKVLQPKNLKNRDFLDELNALHADLQVVVAFRMLPVAVWDMPQLGTMNLHGSLLPRYRGAAPIHWAVINGEKETGLTTFLLKHEIDTGDILFRVRVPIGPDDTTGDLHDVMMHEGAKLVLRSVQAIEEGKISPSPQDTSLVTNAPKIHHDDARIDFLQPVRSVYNFIRGMNPFPGAWTLLDGKELKIYRARVVETQHQERPGSVFSNQKDILRFYGADGYVDVLDVKLEGKRRMSVVDFLNGYSPKNVK